MQNIDFSNRFKSFEHLFNEYKNLKEQFIQKCEKIEVELTDESSDKLFTMYPELFFSVNTLNKLKIHKLIDKGMFGKVNYFKIWNL